MQEPPPSPKKDDKHWIPGLDSEPRNSPSLQVDTISRAIIILAVGIIIGVATASIGLQTLADKLDDLIIGFVTLIVVIGVVTVWIVTNKDKILRSLFGIRNTDLSDLKSQSIDLINNFSSKKYDDAEKNLHYIVSKASAWYVWFNFRRWILIVFQALFIGFGGLLGTILLFSQNLLIEQQTKRLDTQNELMQKQNERMDQQTYLQEADRRSALVFRMDNTWNEVDRELKTDIGRPRVRDLSPELITRIVTLCEMLRPYRYLQGGVLSNEELSQERGQVLISLINSDLDSNTLQAIFDKGNFRYSDLIGVNFRQAYLQGIVLQYAALQQAFFQQANLSQANLNEAQLQEADLSEARLPQCDLSHADLSRAQLHHSSLTRANMTHTRLRGADLRGADLRDADLRDAEIAGANFEGALLQGAAITATWTNELARTQADSVKGRSYLLQRYAIDTIETENETRLLLRDTQIPPLPEKPTGKRSPHRNR